MTTPVILDDAVVMDMTPTDVYQNLISGRWRVEVHTYNRRVFIAHEADTRARVEAAAPHIATTIKHIFNPQERQREAARAIGAALRLVASC